ncbi:hypothetical protein I203_108596 [Kwoniella mangroviensis CBS 8507]|uniref:hypothetical protein n=1 Tax=Kwoniella mangroviensis CBS 8507 TaxID=1296122 RepID=UPI00306B4DC4
MVYRLVNSPDQERTISAVDTCTPQCYLSDLMSSVLMSVQVMVICVFLETTLKLSKRNTSHKDSWLSSQGSQLAKFGLDLNLEAVDLAA